MGETAASATARICQECKEGAVLYVCPRCAFRSCSLACCVAHKQRTSCNGRRNRTPNNGAFVPLSRMSDETLCQDYHFLEHVLQTVESNQRKRPASGALCGAGSSKVWKRGHVNEGQHKPSNSLCDPAIAAAADGAVADHPMLKARRNQREQLLNIVEEPRNHYQQHASHKHRNLARLASFPNRRVHLVFMSPGMQRPLQNKSFVKKQVVHWTIECRVHPPKQPPASAAHARNHSLTKDHASHCNNRRGLGSTVQSSNNDKTGDNTYTFHTLLSEESTVWIELYQLVEQRQRQLTKTNVRDLTLQALLQGGGASYELLLETTARTATSSTRKRGCFRAAGREQSVRDVLQDTTVLEFPTFHFVPSCRKEEFPQLVVPVSEKQAACDSNEPSTNSPNGAQPQVDLGERTKTTTTVETTVI